MTGELSARPKPTFYGVYRALFVLAEVKSATLQTDVIKVLKFISRLTLRGGSVMVKGCFAGDSVEKMSCPCHAAKSE